MTSAVQIKRFLLRRPGLVRLGVVLALFLLWEIAARYWIAPMFLSPPSKVSSECSMRPPSPSILRRTSKPNASQSHVIAFAASS